MSRHRSTAVLRADWVIRRYKNAGYRGFGNPKGPWGIRDNSYVGGKTKSHPIEAKRAPRLVFPDSRTGRIVKVRRVNHPGSKRDNYWETGAARAKNRIVRAISSEYLSTVKSAFDNPFLARK